MNSIPVKEVLRKAASKIPDGEDLVWGDLNQAMSGMHKLLLEACAESEVEKRAGVGFYGRGEERADYRNGYRTRIVQTSFDTLQILVPRLRGQGYIPSFLEPRVRAVSQVEEWVEDAFLSGVDRAKIIRLMEATAHCRPSDDLLKRVAGELDEQTKTFQNRPLVGDYQYLYLDAAWAKDIVGVNATRICIMTALGVTYSGQKEILGFERMSTENEANWRGFLSRLKERGLVPARLELVVSDEHGGLKNAISEVLGDVAHQLCWAHRMRNVRKAVAAADRKEVVAGLQLVYLAKHLVAAKQAFKKWVARWSEKYPNLVASVEEDLGYLLAFYVCDSLHWEYLRTSNPIERVFRELRRQQFGCGAFANPKACNRAVFRIFSWLNRLWQDKNIWDIRKRKLQKMAQAK